MTLTALADRTLTGDEWRAAESRHRDRVEVLTAGWREAHDRGEAHPIEDFLFTYYSYPLRTLKRWNPGAGVTLLDVGESPRAHWRWNVPGAVDGSVTFDAAAYVAAKHPGIVGIASLLERTLSRPGQFTCFGLHEWAMVYREPEHRHPVPLRLGRPGTDAVVDSHRVQCSHFDAYRFFTPDAVGLNRLSLTRENQPSMEQPGCLHANMDLYKWAVKLGPLVPGELLLDAFELARDVRWVDMRASPYDVTAWGAPEIAIETAEGKAEYVRYQREFASRGNAIRERLLEAISSST